MFINYFKTAIRNIWRNKSYSSLNILGLAIGFACAGLIFLWVENETSWDDNHLKKNKLYEMEVTMAFGENNFTMASTPRPMAAAMKAEIPGIANTARYIDADQRLLFSIHNKMLYAGGRYTDASLFSMFTFHFIEGDAKNPFPQLYSLVLTESAVRKFFGTEKYVTGKTVRIDNKQDYVISAVVKDMPENSTLQFEWLAPYDIVSKESQAKGVNDATDWKSYGPLTYVELDKNVNLTAINEQLKNFIHKKSADQTSEAFLYPLKDCHLYYDFANGKPTGSGGIQQVRMLSAIAWIILLIACINFMNLTTASSQKRSKEVGVRKVLGAARESLVTQFMGEVLLMSLLATIIAVVIMTLSLPAFNILMQKQLLLNVTSPIHTLSLLVITIICALIAGSYPSLYLSSFNPVFVLKGVKIKTGSASFVRKGLIILQFAVSVFFTISTIIVYMQIKHVKNRDLGFDKNKLIEINPQHDVSKIFPLIKNDLLSTGVVQNAALADHPTLMGGDVDAGFTWQGKAQADGIAIAHRNVSSEFIVASSMKMLRGRDFSNNVASEKYNIIINESMEKLLGKESAIGKVIQSPRESEDRSLTNMIVIGVVKDYVYGNVYGKVDPMIIFCKDPEYQNFIYVRFNAQQNAASALARITEVMKKNNPAYPLEYKFVDDQFKRMFQKETLISKVSGVFAALAIFISCLGLFGLVAYTTEQRTKEIGIRKVLGASVAGVTTLLCKDILHLVVVACVVAFPVAWWMMHNWLQNYEYRIYISWWIFLASGVSAILIALITISFQSIKAAIANPVKSLRTQ